MKDATKMFLHPIIDWIDSDVWEFIRKYDVCYCSLYDEGFKRLGCVLCPMNRNPKRDIARWPKIATQYVRTLDKILTAGKAKGKEYTWKTGQEWFDWWIQRDTKMSIYSEPVLFE